MLVKHLPRDSSLNRELFGDAAEWSVTDHLLAATVDHLAAANWMFACVNSAEDDDPPEAPEPVRRPDGKPYAAPRAESDPDAAAGSDAAADAVQGAAPADAVSPEKLVRFFG